MPSTTTRCFYNRMKPKNILIHDVKKHLSINTLNDAGETEKIRDYIHQHIASSNLKENLRLCNHEILNAILCRYQKQAKDSHISFLVDIRKIRFLLCQIMMLLHFFVIF